MQKFKFFTLAIITMLSVNLAWGASPITLDVDKFGFSGTTYTTKTYTTDGVTFTMTDGAKNKGLAFKASATLTHNVAIPGNITNITLNDVSYSSSSSAGFYIYVGTSSSSVTTKKYDGAGTGTVSVDIDGSYTFLKIQNKSSRAMYTSSIVITYAAAASTYTVSYELGGGTHGTNHPTSGTIGTAFAVSAPTRSNYTFTGWTVTSGLNTTTAKWGTTSSPSTSLSSSSTKCVNGTSDVYFKDLGSANGSVTLTANWQEKAKYTVTFNAGSGTCSTSSLTESSAGAGVTLPSASPSSACGTDGWTFAGWAAASQAETTTAPTLYAANSNYKPSSNCTLYAVYSKTESSGGGTSEVTFNFGYTDWGKSAQFSGNTDDEVSQEKSGITATYTRNSGSLYANTTSLRFYKSNTLTFDAGSNAISAITFTGTVGQTDITTDVATCSNTSSSLSWSGNSTSVTFTRPSDATSYATLTSATLTVSGGGTTTYNSNPSCATCSNLITITKGTPSHGSFTLTGAGTDICADEPVTVNLSNITADTHYHATAVTSSNGGTPSAITSGSATVTGITASTTINVTFAEDTKVVVTLLNNNNPVNAGGFDAQGKKEYYTGETLGTLPTLTTSDACDATSVTFMGWTTEQITTKRAAAPVFVDTDTPVNAAMTLRAVWARAQ